MKCKGLIRLRHEDPELYELKLFEWDYVASLGEGNLEPDMDIDDGPEIMFTLGGDVDEPETATSSASRLRGGAHHQSRSS